MFHIPLNILKGFNITEKKLANITEIHPNSESFLPQYPFQGLTSTIPRNVIINPGAAEVDNHISKDDIFDYQTLKNVIFILLYRTLFLFPLIIRQEVLKTAQCIFAMHG